MYCPLCSEPALIGEVKKTERKYLDFNEDGDVIAVDPESNEDIAGFMYEDKMLSEEIHHVIVHCIMCGNDVTAELSQKQLVDVWVNLTSLMSMKGE